MIWLKASIVQASILQSHITMRPAACGVRRLQSLAKPSNRSTIGKSQFDNSSTIDVGRGISYDALWCGYCALGDFVDLDGWSCPGLCVLPAGYQRTSDKCQRHDLHNADLGQQYLYVPHLFRGLPGRPTQALQGRPDQSWWDQAVCPWYQQGRRQGRLPLAVPLAHRLRPCFLSTIQRQSHTFPPGSSWRRGPHRGPDMTGCAHVEGIASDLSWSTMLLLLMRVSANEATPDQVLSVRAQRVTCMLWMSDYPRALLLYSNCEARFFRWNEELRDLAIARSSQCAVLGERVNRGER